MQQTLDPTFAGRDSLQAIAEIPVQPPDALEAVMLQDGRLWVVFAVVLVIWFGILTFLFRTDRRLARLERDLDARLPESHADPLA